MPLPGGPSDKVGNRYESWWTLSQLVRILNGDFSSIRIEDPGIDKAEFLLSGAGQERHQAKRSHPSGKWSLAFLGNPEIAVLQAIFRELFGTDHRYVFASSSDARELAELSERARDSENLEEFLRIFLDAKSVAAQFQQLRVFWSDCDEATAYDTLKRVEVCTIDERQLQQKVRWAVQALFLNRPADVIAELRAITQDSIHKTLTRANLVALLGDRGYQMRRITSPETASSTVREVTQRYLDTTQRKLIRNLLVSRPMTRDLVERLSKPGDSVITGRAGSGKTGCVIELVRTLQEQNIPVMSFRLDRLEPVATTFELGRQLGLEESPALVLAAAAKGGRAVLVIDQLDAVSTSSGRATSFLDAIEGLLVEAHSMRVHTDFHVVVVCRKFDWENDHRLRRLIDNPEGDIEVLPFSEEELKRLLIDAGFDPLQFGKRQLELLRLPQNLALFLDSGFESSVALTFGTAKDLFDRYWTEKRRAVNSRSAPLPDQWMKVVGTLCREMTNTQQLSVHRENLDEVSPDYLQQMASEGVVTYDGKRYGFGHESFFDYCFARTFRSTPGTLIQFLTSSGEQHLFRRAQVRQVLAYLRDDEPHRYVTEIQALLHDVRVRYHLKDLTLALVAGVSDPRDEEWAIWEPMAKAAWAAIETEGRQTSDKLVGLAWQHLFTSSSWFEFLDRRGFVQGWLDSPRDEMVNTAVHYLRIHQRHAPDRVATIVSQYVDGGGQWPIRLRSIMEWADLDASRPFFELFLHLIDIGILDSARGPIAANSTFWSMLYGLETARPDWIGEVTAHWLRRRLAAIRESGKRLDEGALFNHDNFAAEVIQAGATKAPQAFVRHLLGPILEISDTAAYETERRPRRDSIWPYLIQSEHPSASTACIEGLVRALRVLGSMNDPDLATIIAELRRRDTYVSNVLLLNLYSALSDRADDALTLVCDEPWRLDCGLSDSAYWYSTELIRSVAAAATPEVRWRLEETVMRYRPSYERSKNGYKQFGYAEFNLLAAIPVECRTPKAKLRHQELERKFETPAGPPRGVRGGVVGPPIPQAAAEKMSDEQWLNAIASYRDERHGFRADDFLKGGASELANLLRVEVSKQPERFAKLSLSFPKGVNPIYLERTLDGLVKATMPSALRIAACRNAYRLLRVECGSAIADVLAGSVDALPDEAIEMLSWLATNHPDPETGAWDTRTNDGVAHHADDILSGSISCTRGRAAQAIGNLIISNRSYVERFRTVLDRLVADPHPYVRAQVAFILRAVAMYDTPLALRLFERLDFSEERLLGTLHVSEFLRGHLDGHFEELRTYVEVMLRSSYPDVRQPGAQLVSLASLHHKAAIELAEEAFRGDREQRLGLAQVAAANLDSEECRAWCENYLIPLFDDRDSEIRSEAGSCFRYLSNKSVGDHEQLIAKFCDSAAFEDGCFSILNALEHTVSQLPGTTCFVCERFLDRFSDEARDMRTRFAGHSHTVAMLAFRTYQQHQHDQWTDRCLSLIDRMCLEGIQDTKREMEQFER